MRLTRLTQSFSNSIWSYTHISTSPVYRIQQRAAFRHCPSLAMKAARVKSWGSPPEYVTVPDLPAPSANELQLKVLAVGIPRVVRGRAAGKHPSAFKASLPYDPSIDGVGLDEATNERYFITVSPAPLLAERVNINRSQLVKLDAAADAVTVAALANPAASSWLALRCRAVGGCVDRTVAIIGATSASGRIAVSVARSLGAARVVGLARNEEALADVEGLDERVVLTTPLVLPPSVGPIDIVIDYVGGPTAVELLQAADIKRGENLQYIQVGGLAGCENHVLPARLINLKPIRIMGSGLGSVNREEIERETLELLALISKMKPPFEIISAPLADVGSIWESEDAKEKRLVLVP